MTDEEWRARLARIAEKERQAEELARQVRVLLGARTVEQVRRGESRWRTEIKPSPEPEPPPSLSSMTRSLVSRVRLADWPPLWALYLGVPLLQPFHQVRQLVDNFV